jgi:undecaprenyl-diphosphatase
LAARGASNALTRRQPEPIVKDIWPASPATTDLIASYDAAFPSGRWSARVYGLLFYFITVFVSQPALRLLGQAACLWVILFTGMQRVYTGVHWPSDVVGGYYLGGLVLAVLIGAHRRLSGPPVTDRPGPRY